jgi:hypothetical protein
MLITIIEAHVPPEKWKDVEIAYQESIRHVPPQLERTFLIQDKTDHMVWRVISFWRSEAAFEEASQMGTHDSCMSIFRGIEVKATRRIFDVLARHEQI